MSSLLRVCVSCNQLSLDHFVASCFCVRFCLRAILSGCRIILVFSHCSISHKTSIEPLSLCIWHQLMVGCFWVRIRVADVCNYVCLVWGWKSVSQSISVLCVTIVLCQQLSNPNRIRCVMPRTGQIGQIVNWILKGVFSVYAVHYHSGDI